MALKFTTSYLEDSLSLFRYYKNLAEHAMEQVTDEQLFAVLDEECNSIAIIVKHIAGNMRSRWTDFLVSDGEKLDRKPMLHQGLAATEGEPARHRLQSMTVFSELLGRARDLLHVVGELRGVLDD